MSERNDLPPEKAAKLLQFVEDSRRKRASIKVRRGDKGECWSLPYKALGVAGADKPCNSCGDEALYVWGREIVATELVPGDILQVEGSLKLTTKDGTHTLTFPHKHHSMIVIEVEPPGRDGPIVKVGHQWPGTPVHYDTIRLGSKVGDGVIRYYRPQFNG